METMTDATELNNEVRVRVDNMMKRQFAGVAKASGMTVSQLLRILISRTIDGTIDIEPADVSFAALFEDADAETDNYLNKDNKS